MRKDLFAPSVILAAVGVISVVPAGWTQPDQAEVLIKNLAYVPAELSVKAGTLVVFRNDDGEGHSVVAKDAAFNSHELAPGKSFAIKFSTPGRHAYFCGVHPFMEGQIVVRR